MESTKYTVPILKQLLKECGIGGYSGKRKAELITMLQASNTPPSPQPQTWEPSPPIRALPPPRRVTKTETRIKQLGRKKHNLESQI